MIDLSCNPYGCYLVYDKNNINGINKDYLNKTEALIEASNLQKKNINAGVSFRYYSSVWENFDFSLCGKISLTTLYKERALQLRDKYNYLILKYSGGSDSHNILHTFLKNNIKIDALYINWPLSAKKQNMYVPNYFDKSPKNELSEWDYTLQHDLNWIAQYYPNIKIFIEDWFRDVMEGRDINDNQIQELNHFTSPVSYYRLKKFSKFQKELYDKGFNVGVIEGAEKPSLYISDTDPNKVVLRFIDWPIQHNTTFTGNGAECFYWTADLPLLPIEMAYQVFLYYKLNKKDRWMLYPISYFKNLSKDQIIRKLLDNSINLKANIIKKVVYPYWNFSRFQADKDVLINSQFKTGKPQDWVFWEHNESYNLQNKWKYLIKSYFNEISTNFLNYDNYGDAFGFKPTYSFPIGGDWYLD